MVGRAVCAESVKSEGGEMAQAKILTASRRDVARNRALEADKGEDKRRSRGGDGERMFDELKKQVTTQGVLEVRSTKRTEIEWEV